MRAAAISYGLCNFCNSPVGVAQQFLGFFNPYIIQVFNKGKPRNSFEGVGKIIGAYEELFRNRGQGNIPGIIYIDIACNLRDGPVS